MRAAPAGQAELQASFQRVLDGITNGTVGMCPMGFGFSSGVVTALNNLALSKNHPAVLVQEARIALAQQLSEAS